MNQAGATFGWALAGPGSVNSTGTKGCDLAVGAPLYDQGQTDEGAVFVFLGTKTGIATSPTTTLEGNQAMGGFGYALAGGGDTNGDGFKDLVVGQPYYDTGTLTDAGRTLVYRGSSTGVSTTPALDVSPTLSNSLCGEAVGGGGDWSGDGLDDVVTGCTQYDFPTVNRGAVFLYTGASGTMSTTPLLSLFSDGGAASFMGQSVAFGGDVDGDGSDEFLFSIPFWASGNPTVVLK
jgi:hypothetical protein